jgi:hypothetical protein
MEILIHDNYALVQGIPTKFISYFYELYFICMNFQKSSMNNYNKKKTVLFSSSLSNSSLDSSERHGLAPALCGTWLRRRGREGVSPGMGWRRGGAQDCAAKLGVGGRTLLVASQQQWCRTVLSSASLGVQPHLPMKDTTPRVLSPMETTGARHVVAAGFRLGEAAGSGEGSYARPGWSSGDWWRREANF